MDTERRLDIIKRNAEEVLTEEDLRTYIETGVRLKHYLGFEISGKIHLGTGIISMLKIADLLNAGVDCNVFLADWHTWINDKLGGDMETIQKVAVGYFTEGMKASLKAVGGDPDSLKFTLGTELYHNNDKYWETVVDVGKHTTLARMQRSITIMGRKEGANVDFAKLLYPAMQVADIFIQGVNIAHAGLDQRKAHVVAREVALKLKSSPLIGAKGEHIKPIALHQHLLLGLQKPAIWPVPKEKLQELWSEMKMSKSIPNSAVFITDTEDEIRRKVTAAFCPEGETEFNPVLDWAHSLFFRDERNEFFVSRPAKFGGDISYTTYAELEKDFASKRLSPIDLKNAVVERLIALLEPVREHFEQPKRMEMLKEMEEIVKRS